MLKYGYMVLLQLPDDVEVTFVAANETEAVVALVVNGEVTTADVALLLTVVLVPSKSEAEGRMSFFFIWAGEAGLSVSSLSSSEEDP